MLMKEPGQSITIKNLASGEHSDFIVQVDCGVGEQAGGGYGLIFKESPDSRSYYSFIVSID